MVSHPQQATVRDMIWEVDENLDEHVDWNEFRTMYQRNVLDKTGGLTVNAKIESSLLRSQNARALTPSFPQIPVHSRHLFPRHRAQQAVPFGAVYGVR